MAFQTIPGLSFNGKPVGYDDGGVVVVTPPPVVTPPVDPSVKVIDMPWSGIGIVSRVIARIPSNGAVAFRFTIPQGASTKGKVASFGVTPTGGNDYSTRQMVLSDKPGDFSGLTVDAHGNKVNQALNNMNPESVLMRFTTGGYAMRGVFMKSPDISNPDLAPGTYYFNVRQKDPTLSCQVDYAFRVPA